MDYAKEIEKMRKQGNKPVRNFGLDRPSRTDQDKRKNKNGY